mmetsp:Transcript_47765/g.102022  ORF Transcript_47765/g.102022 Transcript_47765/m.102022 type:complete len:88 (+) Transcript_47765:70-333(+)
MGRDKSAELDARSRITAQMPVDQKVQNPATTVVIWNNGTMEDLEQQARDLASRLRKSPTIFSNLFSGPGVVVGFLLAAGGMHMLAKL